MKSVRKRFAERNSEAVGSNSTGGENRSRTNKRLLIRAFAVFLLVAAVAIWALSSKVYPVSQPEQPKTPKCGDAVEPYFNLRNVSNATTLDGQNVFVLDGVFSDGKGYFSETSMPSPPHCDRVNDSLITVGNKDINIPTVTMDESGNPVTKYERFQAYEVILGGYSPPDPLPETLSGEQQNQLQPTPTLKAYPQDQ